MHDLWMRPSMVNETIVLVDDNAEARRLAHMALETAGYKVFSAMGGSEALKMLSRLNIQPSLLIASMEMPKMNGFQVANAMMVLVSDLAVLFISGSLQARFTHGIGRNDVAELLPKPFTATALLRKVREILDRPSLSPTT